MSERFTLTIKQMSDLLQVHPNTIKQWINSGCPLEHAGAKGRGRSHKFFLGDVARWLCDREVARLIKSNY